ncbi:hypothetical protein niasHS_011212 [Heterodera schachtii]|uniref:Bromo domain-containing protein n=1 Tax=Heterodera schachtii TaxID=97005 RepID=A0ABD2J0G4_HETSC
MSSTFPCSSSAALIQNASPLASSHCFRFDAQSKTEFLLMIQLYLQSEPKYRENSRALFAAIEQNETIPFRHDVNGIAHPQSLTTYLSSVLPFAASLPTLIHQLSRLQTAANPSPVANFLPIRFFTSRRNALDRRAEEIFRSSSKLLTVVSRRPTADAIHSIHPIMALQSREIGRCVSMTPRTLFRKELYNLHPHTRILGHLSSIFCVAFDRSGRFLFTGADDNLVKVWDAQRCLLRFTFRGHSGEITDLSVSYDNNLLASGSVDKTIRVWCLRKGTAFRIFRGHTGTVNSVQWVPLLAGPMRYLLSAGNDCAVMFQRYNAETLAFEDPPFKFNERATGGARIISASHSPGGNLVIIGDTHQSLMMYKLSAQTVDRLYEFQAHSDRIDTLVWSHHSLRFVSGSKDGTAKVWSLDEEGRWAPVELNPFPTVQQTPRVTATTDDGEPPTAGVALPSSQQSTNRRAANANAGVTPNNGYKLTMLCWTLDDDMVISIGSDFLLRCWDWRRGQLLAKYPGHQNDVFCLNAHPIHKELIVSAGHDGLVIVWNVYNGKQMSKHRNENNDREAVAIFDNQISADGTTVACVDAMGHLSIYGVDHNQEALKRPHEQFFTTDYKLLEIDTDGRVVDADTGELPERLPPPPFVKSDGTLLPETDQRLVPGNDIASKEVIKPCAWLKRDIVPPLNDSVLASFWNRQMEISATELAEFEQKHCPEPSELYNNHPKNNHRLRGLQRRGAIRRPASAATAAQQRRHGGVHYRLAEFLRNRAPRYILDNDYPEDENDRSYSASEDGEVEENDGFMLNGIGHDEHSMSSGGTSDMEEEEQQETENDGEAARGAGRRANGVRRTEEEEDEDDSDYELGRVGRETVFRERSSWTVTGRRKRRPPRPESSDLRQGTSSQETNNGNQADELYSRHSARLRARAQRSAEEQQQQQQQSVSSSSQPQYHRRYKTRQTAFISSSSEGEQQLVKQEEEDEEEEENSRQSAASRTTKSRSAPLANGHAAAVVNGRGSSSGRSGSGAVAKRKKRNNAVGRKKGTAAERRPQRRKRPRLMLTEMEEEEEEEDEQKEQESEEDEEEHMEEEEEEESSDQWPTTSKQSFDHRENGRKRPARAAAAAPPRRHRQLRQRRVAANRVGWTCDEEEGTEEDDGLSMDGSEYASRKLSAEEHERANSHRRIHRFQQSYPQWLRMTERRRFPYFPQLGDEVAYFLQGHKTYLKELKENGIQVTKAMQPRPDLNAMEFCFVDKLEWVQHSGIHMAHLRLARCQNGRRIGSTFQIFFHDMQNVLDFLVLKQHFDASKQLNLQPGNRVESIVDDKFYTGKVLRVTAAEYDSYPNSDWCAVCVEWDNGEDDRYSPWDLQALTKGRKSESPATKHDTAKLGEYHPMAGEWLVPEWALANAPPRASSSAVSSRPSNSLLFAQELFQQRISKLIEQLSHVKEVLPFLEPVDLHLYQDYPTYVFYPMDLTTIQERIHNNFYRRSLAILYDVQMLGKNALAYNKPKYPIVRHACALVETIFVFMEDWKQNDPLPMFRHFVEAGTEGTKYWQLDLLATSNGGGIGSTSTLFTTGSGSVSGSALSNGTDNHQQNATSARLQVAPGPSSSSATAGLPLWASECSAMVDELSEVFRDRVTQRHQNDLFNNFLASLKSVSDAIVEFQTPQAFVMRVRECLKASKEAAEESGTRRSKVFQVILNLESLLQTKEKPILAKHRLMEAETIAHERQHRRRRASTSNSGIADGTNGRNNGQQRHPRKAAVSAYELIQNISQEAEWEEFDDNGQPQEQQRRRHRRQRY